MNNFELISGYLQRNMNKMGEEKELMMIRRTNADKIFPFLCHLSDQLRSGRHFFTLPLSVLDI